MTDTAPDTTLRDQTAEAVGLARNGLASDGRGWYRTAGDRLECYAIADAVLPVFAAMLRGAAQAIEDSRGENLDPLAAAIASGCRVHDIAPAVFDDARTIAIVAYRHLADRIGQPEGTDPPEGTPVGEAVTEGAVRLAASATGHVDASEVTVALDRTETDPPKPCPLGLRLHTPHTWTDGGPIRDCPGITDRPEASSDGR